MSPVAKVLVTDDEEVLLSLLRDCLEADGYDVHVASCGAAAEELIKRHQFDLLVTDIRMPDIDGIELLRRAKKTLPTIGAVFMTGYANVESAKDAIKEGALDYLMKPFEISEIRSAVGNALRKRAELSGKSAAAELNRMTELTKLIYTVGDVDSILKVSLGFALIQSDIAKGAALYWSDANKRLLRIATHNGDMADASTDSAVFEENPMASLEETAETLKDFFVCESRDDHPLVKHNADSRIPGLVRPPWYKSDERWINFPIRRGRSVYGFLMIGAKADVLDSLQNQIKFMTLTAQQTALSIENLALLEQTQRAYQRLQDLQEQTIELETMAARGEMASEIGHELNNFLGVVYGNAALMELKLNKGEVENCRKHLNMVTSNLEKMKSFTHGLMQRSNWTAEKSVIDVTTQLREIIEFLKPQKRFSDVTIRMTLPSTEVGFLCDPLQFQQLLYNIANNAADASRGKSNRWLDFSLTVDEGAERFTISLLDNGEGMTPEAAQQVFQTRFTTKKDGHGYGLVVCRRIIDSHQGVLRVDSTLGVGTRISITFPIAKDAVSSGSSADSTQKIRIPTQNI